MDVLNVTGRRRGAALYRCYAGLIRGRGGAAYLFRVFLSRYPPFFISQNLLGSASLSEDAHLQVGGKLPHLPPPPVVTPLIYRVFH